MSDSLDERPAYCVICGRALEDGDDFIIFVCPEVRTECDGAVVADAVLIGRCCEERLEKRGETFDYLSMLTLFGQLGMEEN